MRNLLFSFILSSTAFCVASAPATSQAAILTRLDQGDSLTISAIGTSLTAADWSSWFTQMGTWLNTKYPGKVTLNNEAIGGSNSNSGINTQLGAALAHNPDVIFIEFAYNDASTGSNMSVETSKNNLQSMINTINTWAGAPERKKTVDIIIQTMNNDPLTGLRPNLEAYYQGYRNVAMDNKLLLIDHDPNWINLYQKDVEQWKKYLPDTIHPNADGSTAIIMPELQKALTSQVPEPPSKALAGVAALVLLGYWGRKRYAAIVERTCEAV